MDATALHPEIVAELSVGRPKDTVVTILDDLSLSFERGCAAGGADLPSSHAAWVGSARRLSAEKLDHWGMSELVDDAKLLISELVTNGFRYGTGQRIVFHLVIGVDVLVMEVDDGSPGRPEIRRAGPDEEKGRGMAIIDAVAASWGVSADATRTWCALRAPLGPRG